MKRLTIMLLLMSVTLTSFAQNKIDFFDLANTFDWKLSEEAFKEKYNDRIVVSIDSIADVYASTGNWLLRDIYIGKYETTTFVRYDNQTKKPAIVSLPTTELLDSMGQIVCSDIEQITSRKLGKPDISLDDMNLAAFNMGDLGIETGNIKMWMSTSPTFMTITAGNDESTIDFYRGCSRDRKRTRFPSRFLG